MHLLLFLSPDWLTFCHVIISYKFTRFFIYVLFLSDEGPMLETLDHTIRLGSAPFFLYFNIKITLVNMSNENRNALLIFIFYENVTSFRKLVELVWIHPWPLLSHNPL